MEEREEILRKRKEEAVNEKARLQKAKELQKKMGQALMHNMGLSGKEADYSLKEEKSKKPENLQSATDTGEHKKTITFVEANDSVPNASKPEWGDVTAAKLRAGQRPTLLQSFHPDTTPLKLNVIERKPAVHTPSNHNRPTLLPQATRDSDDESEPEDDQLNPPSGSDESDEIPTEDLPDSEEDGGELELENEYDLDYAKHQREIALEYYNKRNIIGQDAATAMMDHSHEEDFENESAFEAPAPNNQSKPSVSRFKANRIASAYGASTGSKPSTSIGGSALPESSARTIQHALRSGRIDDDNRLVGGEHDSDSEIEAEGLQEMLELLQKGEVYNLGPGGQYLYAQPQAKPNTLLGASTASTTDLDMSKSAATPSDAVAQQQGPQQRSLPPLNRPKVSRFKADRSQSGRPLDTSRSETSTPPTPITHTSRSSPKLPSAVVANTVVEKNQNKPSTVNAPEGTRPSLSPASTLVSPMIIDSPSFRAPRAGSSQPNLPEQSFTSMVIESPSFPDQPRRATLAPTAPSPPAFPSMIVDSPSFPPPVQRSRRPEHPPTVVPSRNLSVGSSTRPIMAEGSVPTLSPSRNNRTESNPIIATTVLERVPTSRKNASENGSVPVSGKVSRFKQSKGTQS